MQLARLVMVVAAVVAIVAQRLRLPYTVALVIAGLAAGALRFLPPVAVSSRSAPWNSKGGITIVSPDEYSDLTPSETPCYASSCLRGRVSRRRRRQFPIGGTAREPARCA